jgi:hypothetical protein
MSYTWSSILKASWILRKGGLWKVGNGESINIWNDPWIPTSPNRKVVTPRGLVLLTKVNQLLDPISRQWDEELVSSILIP